MEVRKICQWCGKPFIAKKTTTNYCSHQCSKRGYKHRMKERRMELIQSQELLEVKNNLKVIVKQNMSEQFIEFVNTIITNDEVKDAK